MQNDKENIVILTFCMTLHCNLLLIICTAYATFVAGSPTEENSDTKSEILAGQHTSNEKEQGCPEAQHWQGKKAVVGNATQSE